MISVSRPWPNYFNQQTMTQLFKWSSDALMVSVNLPWPNYIPLYPIASVNLESHHLMTHHHNCIFKQISSLNITMHSVYVSGCLILNDYFKNMESLVNIANGSLCGNICLIARLALIVYICWLYAFVDCACWQGGSASCVTDPDKTWTKRPLHSLQVTHWLFPRCLP